MEDEEVRVDTPHSELPKLLAQRQHKIIFQVAANFWQFLKMKNGDTSHLL